MQTIQRIKPSIFVPWIVLVSFLLAACTTSYNMHSLQIEIMKPGLLAGDSIDTIAIFNRNSNYSDGDTFSYVNISKNKIIRDNLIKHNDLQKICLDTLTDYLKKTGYFNRVINYGNALNNHAFAPGIDDQQKNENSIDSINYDACISLDYFELKNDLLTSSHDFDDQVITNYPEFESSTMMETVYTLLYWSISYPGDSSKHEFKRPDNLFYGDSIHPAFFGNEENHRKLINNAAGSLGASFASELIPHLGIVDRVYYHSPKPRMLLAEKNLLSENYREAAEIYRSLTNNKNPHISVKARYNMALICELEGNLDAAVDWLNQSSNVFQTKAYVHKMHCKNYNTTLAKRKEESVLLEKQISYNESKSEN